MKTIVKWGCSAAACLCCGLFAAVSSTVGGAAVRHQSIGRGLYMVLLLAFMLLAWVMFNLPTWLDSAHYVAAIPAFRGCDGSTGAAGGDPSKIVGWLMEHEFGAAALSVPERLCYGTLSVLRVMLGLTVFHVLMALFMVGATSTDRTAARYELQHSWWTVKSILLGVLVVGAFLGLDNVWVYAYNWFAFIGSLVFIFVQILLLIEFAHTTSAHLAAGYHRAAAIGRPLRCATGSGLIVVVVASYVGAIVLMGMTFALVGGHTACGVAWIFATGTALLAVLITLGALLTQRSARGGVVPAAVVVLYCVYLTWSSLSPTALRSVGCVALSSVHADTAVATSADSDAPGIVYVSSLMGLHDISRDAQHVIMLGTAFVALLYAAMRTSERVASIVDRSAGDASDELHHELEEANNPDDDDAAGEHAPATVPQHYNFSLFHIVFMLAACYAAMVLTGWSALQSGPPAPGANPALGESPASSSPTVSTIFVNHTTNSLWVKALSSWVALLLYMWTACAPLVCRACARPK